ncbi:hypothetical protein ACFL6D_05200, partial [Spirochaetota bacterium]
VNENPLPSFTGSPLDVEISWESIDEALEAFYEALGPDNGADDFRVTAACVYKNASGETKVKIKNRNN